MSQDCFLVTGALGCIGAWVVRNLVQAGVTPVIYDLGSNRQRLRQIMSDDALANIRYAAGGDVTDLDMLKRAFADNAITHVIHLAGLQVPFCRANPPLGAQVNVTGTVNLFEAARQTGITRVVYASSIAVYGPRDAYPPGLLPHDAPLDPRSHYGVYKQANEGTARTYFAESGVSSIGLRPYTVYGVGRDQGMTSAPTAAMQAAARGEAFHIPYGGVSGYQHADDVAKLFIQAARIPFEGAGVFNLKGDIAHMRDVVAFIEKAAPQVAGRITFDDTPLPFADGWDDSELVRLMDSIPNRPLEQGIWETIEHFRHLNAGESHA